VHERGRVTRPRAAEVRRRSHLRTDRLGVEHDHVVAESPFELGVRLQRVRLVGLERHVQRAGQLVLAVDPMRLEVGPQRREVLGAEPLERVHLVLEAAQPVGQAVRQRRVQKAAVAPAGTLAAAARLDDHDRPGGVGALGMQRRPQPRVAAADDAEVGLHHALQAGMRLAGRQRVEPVRARRRVGERG
jgi:hypothetical protein